MRGNRHCLKPRVLWDGQTGGVSRVLHREGKKSRNESNVRDIRTSFQIDVANKECEVEEKWNKLVKWRVATT